MPDTTPCLHCGKPKIEHRGLESRCLRVLKSEFDWPFPATASTIFTPTPYSQPDALLGADDGSPT